MMDMILCKLQLINNTNLMLMVIDHSALDAAAVHCTVIFQQQNQYTIAKVSPVTFMERYL